MHPNIGEFAGIFIAFYIAHGVADYWVQTHWQSQHKGEPGRAGALACVRHVASYTACTAVLVAWTIILFGLHVTWLGFVAAQVVSAATHYWADRRYTLAGLCDILGKGDFYRLGAPREVRACTDDADWQAADVVLYQRGVAGPVSWDNPSLGTGAYALDQWWHLWWLFIAAAVTVIL